MPSWQRLSDWLALTSRLLAMRFEKALAVITQRLHVFHRLPG